MEGPLQDWTLYVASGLDEHLKTALFEEYYPYFLYGDSGYSARDYLFVHFKVSNVKASQCAFNKEIFYVRITVEWMFNYL